MRQGGALLFYRGRTLSCQDVGVTKNVMKPARVPKMGDVRISANATAWAWKVFRCTKTTMKTDDTRGSRWGLFQGPAAPSFDNFDWFRYDTRVAAG